MTTASPPPQLKPPPSKAERHEFDPDSYRMTIGEHLEDLRWRLVLGLLGFGISAIICFLFAERVMVIFCRPLIQQLEKHHLNPQMYYNGIGDPFMTYLKVTLISAGAIAGPWMLYQLWQFVSAGLYPHERKIVTKYIPLSVTLLISGMLFVYFLVLPLAIGFFIEFSSALPLPPGTQQATIASKEGEVLRFPEWEGDPAHPLGGQVWVNTLEHQLKLFTAGETFVLQFGPKNLLVPHITLPDYVDLVMTFLLTFGLAFQLPLVVMALVRTGIVEVPWLKKQRRLVYFVMAVAAAFIAPGDIVLSMLSLLIPLMLLYEFGLWLASTGAPPPDAAEE